MTSHRAPQHRGALPERNPITGQPETGLHQAPAPVPERQQPDGFIVRVSVRLSAAAAFWYILGCIAFGGMYLAKVPAKKALAEAGLAEMTAAEKFWYVVECIGFGGGYFAKLPVKKALSEASMYAVQHR